MLVKRKKDKRLHSDIQNNTQKTEQHESIKNRGRTQVPRKGKQFIFHMWHLTRYSCYKRGRKS